MNKILITAVMLGMSGAAYAADFSDMQSLKVSDIKAVTVEIPVPVMQKAAGVTSAFRDAVKKEYETIIGLNNGTNTLDKLPVAKVSELPPGAQKQLAKDNHQWGPDYLSVPYKMPVQGQTVYVIQNENDGGMFVTIFDANGSKVAEGSCSESGDFHWSK